MESKTEQKWTKRESGVSLFSFIFVSNRVFSMKSAIAEQTSQAEFISGENGAIDHESSGNGGSQSAPKNTVAFFLDALVETIHDSTVLLKGEFGLSLKSGFHYVEWVAANPAGDAGQAAGDEHRSQRLLAGVSAAGMKLLSHEFVSPKVKTVRRSVSEHRDC